MLSTSQNAFTQANSIDGDTLTRSAYLMIYQIQLTPQVWHAAIVVAIIFHYRATFVAHTSRFEYSCAMADAGQEVGEAWDDMWAYIWETVRSQ